MSYRRRLGSGGRCYSGCELQWQPSLTVHDPNPPITLESPTGGAFSLAAAEGSYTLSGTATTLKAGRYVGASGVSYTHAGTVATLKAGRYISGAAGAFNESGTAAILKAGRYISGAAVSYLWTGTAASLIYTPVSGFTLVAASGSFALAGTSATLFGGRYLSGAAGSYLQTGTAVGLFKGSLISAGSGSFDLAGTSATLKSGHYLASIVGSYALTGTVSSLERGALVPATSGSFPWTGSVTSLRATRRLDGIAGSISFIGTNAVLFRGRILSISLGTFTLVGASTSLTPVILAPPARRVIAPWFPNLFIECQLTGTIIAPKSIRLYRVNPLTVRTATTPSLPCINRQATSAMSTLLAHKAPTDVFDYTIDYLGLLDGDTINTSSWTIPAGITKDSDSKTTTTVTIWLSGGTAGADYQLTNTIVTVGLRTFVRVYDVSVRSNI